MKKRRIDLDEQEIDIIVDAIRSDARHTEEVIEVWAEGGGQVPEYLQTRLAMLRDLKNRLLSL